MSEQLNILYNTSKEEQYENLWPQIKSLLEGETDTIANMANLASVLKQAFSFYWVGFYLVKKEQLVLGPFQGTIACTRIAYGKGVCGTAWKENRVVLVPDVDAFEGHIACDSASRSEIVIPVVIQNQIVAVLDVDSEHLAHFDSIDKKYLQKIVKLLETNMI